MTCRKNAQTFLVNRKYESKYYFCIYCSLKIEIFESQHEQKKIVTNLKIALTLTYIVYISLCLTSKLMKNVKK